MTQADEIDESMRQIGFLPELVSSWVWNPDLDFEGPANFSAFVAIPQSGPKSLAMFFVKRLMGPGVPRWWSERVAFHGRRGSHILMGSRDSIEGTMREIFDWASGGGAVVDLDYEGRHYLAEKWRNHVVQTLRPRLSTPEGSVVADQLEYEGLISGRDVSTWPPEAVRRFWLATNAAMEGARPKRNPKSRLMR